MNKFHEHVKQSDSLSKEPFSPLESITDAIIPYVQDEIRRQLLGVFSRRFELICTLYKPTVDDAYVQYNYLAAEVLEIYKDAGNSELHDEYYALLRAIDAKQADISNRYEESQPEYE